MSEPLFSETASPSDEKRLTPQDAPFGTRALILFLICCMQIGTYYDNDIPGAIQKQLSAWFGSGYTEASNSLLYSVYSWPNCFLPLFGGVLIDKILGIRKSVILFITFITLGQLIFSIGISSKIYGLCVLGRFILGLGGESMCVAQNQFTVRWFKGPSLAIVFGLILATARIGSSINFVLTPYLASIGVDVATWVATFITVGSWVACILLVFVDWSQSKYTEAQEEAASDEGDFKCSDVGSFPKAAWILFAICAFFYIGVLVFYQVASVIIQETSFHLSPATATLMLAIPNFLSIFCSPTFGRIIDRVGYTIYGLIIASLVMVTVQLGFLSNAYNFILIHPAFLMFILGLAYAVGATMWTIIPTIIEEARCSTAFGLMTSIQNCSLSLFPLVIAGLQQLDGIDLTIHKYGLPIIVFITCMVISSTLCTWLSMIDAVEYKGRINLSSAVRHEMDKQLEHPEYADVIAP